jgi:hypothetical protein
MDMGEAGSEDFGLIVIDFGLIVIDFGLIVLCQD